MEANFSASIIENKEKLEQSEDIYRLLVENVQDYAIFMLDSKGRVATWNRGAEYNKGYKESEILGRHFSIFYPEEEVAIGKPDEELKMAIRDGRYEEEGWRVRKDGTRFWGHILIAPVYGSNHTLMGFAKVTRNLTERKEAETALRKAYLEMEDRVQQRTEELTQTLNKLENALAVRDRFFSVASHELKTPLTNLKLQIQLRKKKLLKDDYVNLTSKDLLEFCEEDERQIDRLVFLVENMLDISKIQSGHFQLHLEDFEINEMLKDVINRLTPILSATRNPCFFHGEKPIFGRWDKFRLEQAVVNLLTNASKYAPNTPIIVSTRLDAGMVCICVKDSGPGIPKSQQEKVFHAFKRAYKDNDVAGLGLGLHIVKRIIEAHGGCVLLESEVGKGSTFTLELPLRTEIG